MAFALSRPPTNRAALCPLLPKVRQLDQISGPHRARPSGFKAIEYGPFGRMATGKIRFSRTPRTVAGVLFEYMAPGD